MADRSAIEWTEATWNPVTGCDRISAGCDHCCAMTLAKRLKAMGSAKYQADGDPRTSGPGFGVTVHPQTVDEPRRWRNSRVVFVNSMSDLFHDQVPDEYVAKVWAVMALSPRHTFQVLTKRHGRMRSLLSSAVFDYLVRAEVNRLLDAGAAFPGSWEPEGHDLDWPLPNVWLGVSAENQMWADIRIPALLDTPAAVRFVSAEPLLGPIDLIGELCEKCDANVEAPECNTCYRKWWIRPGRTNRIDWVIVGGESGPGARPMHPDWARSLRDQCQQSGTVFFYKQWGEFAPESAAARVADDGSPRPDLR